MKTLLRKAREQKGMKTREVALTLDIDQALISKFETGHRRPTREQVVKLAALLEIDLETILVLWLKEKILDDIKSEEFGMKALKAAELELNPAIEKDNEAINTLFDEMNALKNKIEGFRNAKGH